MWNTECIGKWNISATLAIQASESSTLCCSRESSLMMYISESIESFWLSWYSISRLLSYLADLARPITGCRGTHKAMDSPEAGLDVIKVLSREKHSVLVFKTWIDCVAEIFHFPYDSGFHVGSTLKNGISRQRIRFKPWKVAHCVALAKVV